jgi:hypothetical protein
MNKKYCQNPLCYARDTQDRLRGVKGSKVYQNRVINHNHYYGCCTQQCLNDFLEININRIIGFIGAVVDTPTRPQQQYITRNEYLSMRSNLRDRQ